MFRFIMLIVLGGLTLMAQATSATQSQIQIERNIKSFAALADQNAFGYLGRLFDDSVTIDYTSAFGGEPADVDVKVLMGQWAGLLPGFDVTYHDLSNIHITLDGNTATATADVTASHFIGTDGFWQISGQYDFTLRKKGDEWVITLLRLNAKDEAGSRDVLGLATEKAATNHTAKEQLKIKL